MPARMSTGLRDSVADKIVADFTDCVIDVYDGVQPASPNDVPAGTKIGSITESGGAFSHGSATNGLEFQSNSDGTMTIKSGETWIFTSIAAGTARWARIKTNATDDNTSSTTQKRFDFDIGINTGNLRMTKVAFTAAAQTATVTAATITIKQQGSN